MPLRELCVWLKNSLPGSGANSVKKLVLLLILLFASLAANAQAAFDQTHAAWSSLLKKNVAWSANGNSSTVDYAGFKKDQVALNAYVAQLSAVKETEFKSWTIHQQRAFLINAYNAYTIELILSSYPNLKSIKDLGGLLSSPWSKSFFFLLDQKRSLDDVEHKLLRGAKNFNEPRVHFAANCASVGCPALRPEAYEAAKFEAQLEDQTKRFLSDRSRNRFDKAEDTLYLSRIFDWYDKDFGKDPNAKNLSEFLARYSGSLGLSNAEKVRLKNAQIDVDFLDYNWSLNNKIN
jgi:Protein of unknown function, DUF547